jgi:3-aminobutanoyl-CoA transaminase
MSIFLKTGSDATTASIRIARAHTGKLKVMRCGYHGWHDWCVEMKGGIPSKFFEDVFEFQYNRLDQLEQLMAEHGSDTAAIIMTPFGHPNHQKMQVPEPGFLEGVKDIAQKYGAVLIYDEIRTGFRVSMGGAQKYYGVTPDISVLGKAIANGYPISVVTGKKEIMMAASHKLFISSTFFPNSDAFVAALKTIEILERDKVLEDIWTKGEAFMARIQQAIDTHDVGAKLTGIPPCSTSLLTRMRTAPTRTNAPISTPSSSARGFSSPRSTMPTYHTATPGRTWIWPWLPLMISR